MKHLIELINERLKINKDTKIYNKIEINDYNSKFIILAIFHDNNINFIVSLYKKITGFWTNILKREIDKNNHNPWVIVLYPWSKKTLFKIKRFFEDSYDKDDYKFLEFPEKYDNADIFKDDWISGKIDYTKLREINL